MSHPPKVHAHAVCFSQLDRPISKLNLRQKGLCWLCPRFNRRIVELPCQIKRRAQTEHRASCIKGDLKEYGQLWLLTTPIQRAMLHLPSRISSIRRCSAILAHQCQSALHNSIERHRWSGNYVDCGLSNPVHFRHSKLMAPQPNEQHGRLQRSTKCLLDQWVQLTPATNVIGSLEGCLQERSHDFCFSHRRSGRWT